MKGYQGQYPDIYDEVVNFLEKEINSLTDESTEIIVLPFQENILETWKVKATKSGKEEIITKIKRYNNNTVTNTNIVGPIKHVLANIIDKNRRNLLVLLTDGKQTGGNAELVRLIRGWGEYAKINDVYAVYVMLTSFADEPEIIRVGEETEGWETVPPGIFTDFIDFQPTALVKFNIRDDRGKLANVFLTCRKDIVWPDNIKIQVVAKDNPYIQINQTVVVANSRIAFKVEYKQLYQRLRNILSEKTRIPIHLKLVNKKEIQKNEGKIISLMRNDIELELINKPEKTLRIHVKK
jgi:hypothetical protein